MLSLNFDGKTIFAKKKQRFISKYIAVPKDEMVRLLLLYCGFLESPY